MGLGQQLRSLVTENLNLKLLSLAFALLLYSVVHGSQEAQRSLRLNIVALLPGTPNRVLMTTIPEKINVTVRGPKSTLDDLNADDLGSVQLDLRSGTDTRVLFDPPMKSYTLLLWYGPFALLLIGLAGLVFQLRKRKNTLPEGQLSAEQAQRAAALLNPPKDSQT